MISLRTRPSSSGSTSAASRPDTDASASSTKVLPRTDASWTRRRSSGSSPSIREATSACSVSGTSSGFDLADDVVRAVRSLDLSAVHEHADGLDRVQRDALGTCSDRSAQFLGQPGHEALQERVHRVVGERLESEPGEAPARRRAEPGAALEELGPRESQDEDRLRARPLDEVLDEVEEAGVGPLEVLEYEHRRRLVRQATRRTGARRRTGPRARTSRRRGPRRWASRGSTHSRSVASGTCSATEARIFAARGRCVLVLEDPGAPAHHLGERPVGDALAV